MCKVIYFLNTYNGWLAQNRKFKEKDDTKQDQLHYDKETGGATSI
jgi:hypothetical protein